MNSNHYSSLLVGLVILVLAVGAVGAVDVSDDAPSDARVGTDVTATFEVTDLYSDYNQWTLRGQTELTNVTWTVEVFDVAGDEMADQGSSYDGQEFGHSVDKSSNAAELRVSVTGTVPSVSNYSYEPEETFLVATLTQARQNGSSSRIDRFEAHHYTDDSRSARQAIDAAQSTIEDAGGNQEAERTLDAAISAYENENFQNAIDLANQAEETAASAKASQDRTELILMAVGGLILLGAVVGGVMYWRNSRTHSRL